MGKNFELLGRKSQGEILRTYVSVKRVALESPRTMPPVSFSAGVLRQHRPLCYLARVSGRRHFKCNRDLDEAAVAADAAACPIQAASEIREIPRLGNDRSRVTMSRVPNKPIWLNR